MFASIAFFLVSSLSFLSTFSEAVPQKVPCEDPQGCNANIHGRVNVPLIPACQGPDGPIYEAGDCTRSLGSSSSSIISSPSITSKIQKSTGKASSMFVSTHHITPTLTCKAEANTASLVPWASVKPDSTVCSCDNGQYYSTLSNSGSRCAYNRNDPFNLSPPNGGPWSLDPLDLQPSVCTASVFPVSTTKVMPTGEFVIWPNFDGNSIWLFSADKGVNLSSLSYGEFSGSPFTRNANGSYTLVVPAHQGGWTVTGVASGTSAKVAEAYAHEFALTLSTTLTCDVPLPVPCTASSNQISFTQWDAFRTDEWWKSYVSNFTTRDTNYTLFQTLYTDYIGPLGEYPCTIGTPPYGITGNCDTPSCVSINTTLSSKPGFGPAYLVFVNWEGLNSLLNFMYNVFEEAAFGFQGVITEIYISFFRAPGLGSWQTLLPVVGTFFTLICVCLLILQPFWGGLGVLQAANLVYATSAAVNGIANIRNLNDPSVAVIEWAAAANCSLQWQTYTQAMQAGLEQLHDDYFINAVNISTILLGGAYLPIPPTVNETQALPSINVTAWLEAYASAKLINQLFVANDYYIAYIPYGSMVQDVPGYKTKNTFSFERSDCEQWIGSRSFIAYATCDTVDAIGPGMTIMDGPQLDLSLASPVNYTAVFTTWFAEGNFTYKPEDVIQASVSGWMNYGYNYSLIDGSYGFSPGALDSVENFKEQLFAVANIRSNDSGVYNLPVCVLNQLDSIPECASVWGLENDGDPITQDQARNCLIFPNNCLGDQSGVLPTQNASYGFQYFRDHISEALKDSLDNEYPFGPWPGLGPPP